MTTNLYKYVAVPLKSCLKKPRPSEVEVRLSGNGRETPLHTVRFEETINPAPSKYPQQQKKLEQIQRIASHHPALKKSGISTNQMPVFKITTNGNDYYVIITPSGEEKAIEFTFEYVSGMKIATGVKRTTKLQQQENDLFVRAAITELLRQIIEKKERHLCRSESATSIRKAESVLNKSDV